MNYTVITENDTSQWKDETGEIYHFPSRYLKYLQPGTQVLYYKGRMTDKKFQDNRMSPNPHYFAVAEIRKVFEDIDSAKNDQFAEVVKFKIFPKSVHFKLGEDTIEKIPTSRESNYWRDGVRPITKDIFDKVVSLAGLRKDDENSSFNDAEIYSNALISEVEEGGRKIRYTTYYERNAALRQQAVDIHGYTCKACKINFKEFYGEWGEGFIHVHHLKPISSYTEKQKINPHTDLVVLCANCHSMIHRRRDRLLSVEELIGVIINKK